MMMTLWSLFTLVPPLALLVLAVRTLKRTRDPAVPLSPADLGWRNASLALLVLSVAGFGLCGGFGTFAGLSSFMGSASSEARAYGTLFLVPGVVGLLIALIGVWLLRKYRRVSTNTTDTP